MNYVANTRVGGLVLRPQVQIKFVYTVKPIDATITTF